MSHLRFVRFIGAAVVAALCAAPALAGRPGPPSPPIGGKIFFAAQVDYGAGIYAFSKMNADGSNKTPLHPDVNGAPSRMRHPAGTSSYYWFLSVRPVAGTFCNGTPRHELFAVREDNNVVVQLTDGGGVDLDIQASQIRPGACWMPGDSRISYIAAVVNPGDCMPLQGGIYTRPVSWDAGGNLVVTAPAVLTVPLPIVDLDPDTPPGPDIIAYSRFDWDPTGTKVAYADRSWHVNVFDTLVPPGPPGSPDPRISQIRPSGRDVSWSPLGNRIAATGPGWFTETFNPDGTGVQTMVDPNAAQVLFPAYSPTGAYLIHERRTYLSRRDIKTEWNVWRTTPDFANGTDLTKDIPSVTLIGWSAD